MLHASIPFNSNYWINQIPVFHSQRVSTNLNREVKKSD